MTIAYDGTLYSGWQTQPNAVTVQETIEHVLAVIIPSKPSIWGSGRTDAGVHASGQVAHFKTECSVDIPRLTRSLNGLLPPDIRILQIEAVDPSFHSQFSAQGKIYWYHLCIGPCHIPMQRLYSHWIYKPIDLELLKHACTYFVGEHDFTTFANSSSVGSAGKNPVRTIYRLDLVQETNGARLEFEGNGFLYKMVRNITGTLLEVATGRRPVETIPELFEARNRRIIGIAAPARGLFLKQVHYAQ